MKLLQRFLPKAIRENLKTTHLETIFWNNNHPNMNFWDYFYLFFPTKTSSFDAWSTHFSPLTYSPRSKNSRVTGFNSRP